MASTFTPPKQDDASRSDSRWGVVERIAQSDHLKSSPRLCQFLYYVSECAIRGVPEEATEQQIGIRVFGRLPGYNSSEDSIVRSHARILRQKLDAYFEREGVDEKVILEIPKGHYLPSFKTRNTITVISSEPKVAAEAAPTKSRARISIKFTRRQSLTIGLTILLIVLVSSGFQYWRIWNKMQGSKQPVELFWQPFLTGEKPIVIYSNALFTGNSKEGLRYAPPTDSNATLDPKSAGSKYVDTYTGIGELASVYSLTRLFDEHKAGFILKRSMLVTWDEAEMRNLVFIGSPAENTSLSVLPGTQDFTMVAAAESAGVVNRNPLPGEQAVYSRPEHPLTKDYAILALLPGVQPSKRILIFSGLTTFGTQASVEYVCQPETAAELLKKITGPKGEIRPFEAVLETTIRGGVPLQTRMVTIHVH